VATAAGNRQIVEMRVTQEDVRPMVDQMIDLLRQTHVQSRWMDWDSDRERQPESIGSLGARIQQALGLIERSRGREKA
jgi:hypothetical protein